MKVTALTSLVFVCVGCSAGCSDSSLGPDGDRQDVVCPLPGSPPPATGFFADISESSGIRADNFDPDPVQPIPINDHSRLGFADIDGDGDDDIVMHSLYPNPENGIPFEHLVFRNRGDGTFENASDVSGLRSVQAGFFVFGDVDNDGDLDVFAGLDVPLPGLGHQLLENDGAGRFSPVAGSGVEGPIGSSSAGNAVFADFDLDGNLDLYVGNGHTRFGARDALYLGRGDATFSDASSRLTGNPQSPSNGSVACDYDDDGDLDIFVSVYGVSAGGAQNLLWENDGTGRFTNVAAARGFSSLPGGNYHLGSVDHGSSPEPGGAPGSYIGSNGFGLQCEDITGDGHLDVFATAISHPDDGVYSRRWSDPTALFVNLGPDGGYSFENQFLSRGLPFNEGDVDGAAVDFDNDGLLDLSVSRERKYEGRYADSEQKAWFGLFRQGPDGMFSSVGIDSGINDPDEALRRMKGAQNHAWSDIDLDGDLDLLVGGRDQGGGRPNFLFENRAGEHNPWIAIHLRGDGDQVPRDPIGTRVSLVYADRTLTRELKSSRGMHSSLDTRTIHFGLGDLGCDFELHIRWPDGTVQQHDGTQIAVGRHLVADYGAASLSPL